MKEVFCALMVITVLMSSMVAVPAQAEDLTDGVFNYTVSGNEASITGLKSNKSAAKLEIPETIDDFTVTNIDSYAFHAVDVKEIVVPDTVELIGFAAFSNAPKLQKVTLPANLEDISRGLFARCRSLKTVIIKDKVMVIQSSAFYGCTALEEVTLPKTLKQIDSFAFDGCIKLKKINGNFSRLERINSCAFEKCYSLRSIVLPKSVKKLGGGAFGECTGLQSVTFDGSNTKLSTGCFSGCNKLEKVTLPSGLRNIPDRTFRNCRSLKSIQLPNRIVMIKRDAFYKCESLKNIKMGENIYAIGDGAFAYSGLERINLNEKMQFIGNGAFCNTDLRTINLGDKITFIGRRVFANCQKMKKICIPKSVIGINPMAFNNCFNLRSLNVASDNKHYSSRDGVLFNKNLTKLIQYPLHKTDESFVSPLNMCSVRKNAFSENPFLRNVTVSARIIREQAFSNMENLRTLTLTNTTYIGKSAFYNNKNLTKVSLPNSVRKINRYAFSFSKIATINIPSNLRYLKYDAFNGCYGLKSFTGGSAYFKTLDGVLFNSSMTRVMKYPSKKASKVYVALNSVRNVSTYAAVIVGPNKPIMINIADYAHATLITL